LASVLADKTHSQSVVYAIENQISDSTTFSAFKDKDTELLKTAINYCRAIKSQYELDLLAYASDVTCDAHVAVMKATKHMKSEREVQSLFLKLCMDGGCIEQGYSGIFASGTAPATLHYQHNDAPLEGKLNMLVDAGAEMDLYTADVTRTWPINGKFTKESKEIYEITLKMQDESLAMIKAGALWDDIHSQAHRVLIDGFLKIGILKGDPQELFDSRVSVAFYPHGLGHYLGMDTHDTGGDPNYADKDPMFRYLRKRGHLEVGNVITVEPGIYMCKYIIEPYIKKPETGKYIDAEVLEKYWEVGGVRIEDNVVVLEDGYKNLTTAPKTVADLEALISAA
jgi:Xaa-Pro dipeptidase